ncbi:MAG: cell division protein FtsA [Endomicrobia bacterium]|nr:cell division protein FtsA [Endomicrobiia bacterium]MCL2507216.1 cell division protein FtsA [Endomicrobiia bacterium]
MPKQTLIAGVDIGSNQVCCVAGVPGEDGRIIKILGSSVVPCNDGIKAGAVINIQEAALAVSRAFDETEKAVGSQIGSIIVAVRGSFVEPKNSTGSADINNSEKKVTPEVVANVLDSARNKIKIDSDRQILQIVPKEFTLNQQKDIRYQNPIGMSGSFIEVDVHALIAGSGNIDNIMTAVDAEVDGKIYSYLAASDVLVTKEEKELGCLVVDFGGLTTGLVHYVDGILRYTSEIPVGSDNITRDIMHKLRASFAVSKEVKEMYGAAFEYPDFKNEEFEYRAADGRSMKKFDKAQLMEIIQPRIEQVLFSIDKIMKDSAYGEQFLSGGIILTGGGSLLMGLPEAVEKYFGCSVRVGVPNSEKVIGVNDIVSSPVYTAAIGAAASALTDNYGSYVSSKTSSKNGFFSKAAKWFEDTF